MTRNKINPTVIFVETVEEQTAAIALLPTLSAVVFKALLDALYAEPGFSDVEVKDLAASTGNHVSTVAGAIGYLVEHGLVQVERANVNGKNYRFVHLAVATSDVYGRTDSRPVLRQAVEARLANGRKRDKSKATVRKAGSDAKKASARAKAEKAAAQAEAEAQEAARIAALPRFAIKLADGGVLEVRAENAKAARVKAIESGVVVFGRAYPLAG